MTVKSLATIHLPARSVLRRPAPFILLLFFWMISIWNLDRIPIVHPDEPWILSPGYKLFTQGIYGSDLFAGFNGMEYIYFEFMPLMSLLQGAGAVFFGVGVMQMRIIPVMLGAITLALSFAFARRIANTTTGALTMFLLLFWQWATSGTRLFGSGIPLIDLARVARYDILVAPLGLSTLLMWMHARRTHAWRFYFLSGLLAGFAGMAHLYGAFWIAALVIVHLLDHWWFERRTLFRATGLIIGGAGVVWLAWIAVALLNWNYFVGQTTQYGDRFNVFNGAFYLQNLALEGQRYNLGIRNLQSLMRIGLWMLVGGVPIATVWVITKAARDQYRKALWLLVPSILFPILFALLIRVKTFNYLVSVAPFYALMVAWCIVTLFNIGRGARLAIILILTISALQSAWSIGTMQFFVFYQQLRQVTPPQGRILGAPQYWLAMPQRDYRAAVLPFFLSNPRLNQHPLEFEEALTQIKPDIVFIDAHITDISDNYGDHLRDTRQTPLRNFLLKHNARLVAKIADNYGEPFFIYQLDW
ncbi:MAG: hypothetical protein HY740_01715 [Chloroflexi bacterium]|nr:hypothetical protein [Chloroflexota bacterium]